MVDEIVRAAMARWPDVPAAFGWLRLDRRGRWWLVARDRADFDPARDGRGSMVTGEALAGFIGRNYAPDAQGRWYFQNGPQRVFVDLELAPLVFRVDDSASRLRLVAHTGAVAERIERILFDRHGNVLVLTDLGPGAIDDRQLVRLEARLEERADGIVLRIDPDGTGAVLQVQTDVVDAGAELGFVNEPR
ncbi:MAG: DUF2946 family protein [Burkholderiales bacterium]|nr:MAG: DUF2946 family protein [Burkholderiales bacterium]